MKDFLKLCVVLTGYLVLAPMLGRVLAQRRTVERAVLCLMLFMTSWVPGKITLMIGSVELYRGHTKGYEFSLIVALGIALTAAARIRLPAGSRLAPQGLWLYLLYCGLSALSILAADNKGYALMATWKFTSAAMIFVGAYHGFRDAEDLRWVLRTLAGSLILQCLVCLKMRFVDSLWQAHGWFEHQNPMCMWAYLCAIPVLAAAFSPSVSRRDSILFFSSVGATALSILLAVSRAGLAAFVIGSVAVTGLAFLRGFTARKLTIAGIGACAATAAGILALDSLMARVQEDASRECEQDLRAILNLQSKAMVQESPIGIGWNNFGVANSLPNEKFTGILMDWDVSRGFRIVEENYEANPLTESMYWLLLSETGYPGFVSNLAFLALTLWWASRATYQNWNTLLGYVAGGVLVALFLTYVHGSVERCLSQTKNLSLWLLMAGFMARCSSMPRVPKVARLSRRPSLPLRLATA